MGFYIEQNSKTERLPVCGKAAALIADGAAVCVKPALYGATLVAVVENGHFDSALLVDNHHDFARVMLAVRGGDTRPLTWLLYPHAQEVVTR